MMAKREVAFIEISLCLRGDKRMLLHKTMPLPLPVALQLYIYKGQP